MKYKEGQVVTTRLTIYPGFFTPIAVRKIAAKKITAGTKVTITKAYKKEDGKAYYDAVTDDGEQIIGYPQVYFQPNMDFINIKPKKRKSL